MHPFFICDFSKIKFIEGMLKSIIKWSEMGKQTWIRESGRKQA